MSPIHIGPQAYWPADVTVPLDNRPVGQVLLDWATDSPEHIAVQWLDIDQVRALTYAELAASATAFASRLAALVSAGERVAIAASTSVDWLIFEYAAALAATPIVPVNPAMTDAEITHILASSDARLLFADAESRGQPLLDRLVPIAAQPGMRVYELAAWRNLPTNDASVAARRLTVRAADPFLVQYTSGTTGRPKGAVLSHRAAFNSARLMMMRFGATSNDSWLNVMPMHHVGGSVSVALSVLSVGATVTLMPAFEPGLALRMASSTQATIFGGVPTMLIAMLEHESFATTRLSSLRLMMSGGSVLPTALIRRVEESFGVTIINAYGQSESPNAIMTGLHDDDLTKSETIGTPLPHRQVRIASPDGHTLPNDQIGELLMRSPLTMDRYIGVDPAVSAETLGADGWLHTGDLCSMDDGGVVRIHGRVRDVVIRGGENIYPAEIEDVMLRHPAIGDIAVIGVPDDLWGEVPVGVIREAPGARVDDAELVRHGREQLASFKVPRRWIRVDSFPITASGKVKKYELQALINEADAANRATT